MIRDGARIQKVARLKVKRNSRKFRKSVIQDVTSMKIEIPKSLIILSTHLYASIMIQNLIYETLYMTNVKHSGI